MIARIQYQGKAYYSFVFAHFQVDYMNYYVVYDTVHNKFDMVALFSKKYDGHRQVGLINENESGFIGQCDLVLKMGIAERLVGYPWILKDPEYLRNVELGKDLPEEFVEKAKKMNASIDKDKWNEVTNEEEVENMINHTGAFHDQYLVEMKAISDDADCFAPAKLQIRFTSQGPFDVLVEFEDGLYIELGFYSSHIIFTSTVVIGEKYIYWVYDAEDGLLEEEVKKYQHIQCKKLRWKFILKKEDDW